MAPVGLIVRVAGSYNSAEDRGPPGLNPPAIKTLPVGKRVAVGENLTVFKDPVVLNVPVAESYSSAE
jgi:hypothetical protein